MKEVKVRVLPLMPPAPAVRVASKLVAFWVGPVRPRKDRALPVPVMARSVAVPVLILSVPLTTEEAVSPAVVDSKAWNDASESGDWAPKIRPHATERHHSFFHKV